MGGLASEEMDRRKGETNLGLRWEKLESSAYGFKHERKTTTRKKREPRLWDLLVHCDARRVGLSVCDCDVQNNPDQPLTVQQMRRQLSSKYL